MTDTLDTATEPPILSERRGRIAVVILNRPQVMNAWNREMRQLLVATLRDLGADDTVGAIVLTGAGSRAFGAGQDFHEARGFDAARAEDWIAEWAELYGALRDLEKPTVAALNGVAAGSAFQFALLCDLRVGHPGIRMGQPEIDAGIPSTTGPWAMLDKIGMARTIELTLTGQLVGGEDCERLGLISRIVAEEDVMPTAIALAEMLAAKPPVAMRLNKRRFRDLTEPAFQEALAAGVRAQGEAYGSGEPARMMERFLGRGKD